MPPSPFIPMAVILFHCVTTAQPPQPCSVDGSCNSAAGAFPDLPLQEYFWSICICCTVRPINVHLCKLQLLSSRRGPLGPHPSQHLILDFFSFTKYVQFSWHCGRLPDLPDLNFQILWKEVIFSVPIRLPRASQVVLVVKNSPTNARDERDTVSVPGLGRFPGGGHDNPLQYSCLENPMDRGGWWATVHRAAKSWTQLKWLSTHTHACTDTLDF